MAKIQTRKADIKVSFGRSPLGALSAVFIGRAWTRMKERVVVQLSRTALIARVRVGVPLCHQQFFNFYNQ